MRAPKQECTCSQTAGPLLRSLRRFTRGNRLLDYEASCSSLAAVATAAGWDVCHENRSEELGWDAIVVRGVLRQSASPTVEAKKIAALLRPGGTLAVVEYDIGPAISAKLPILCCNGTVMTLWTVEALTRLFGPLGIGAPFRAEWGRAAPDCAPRPAAYDRWLVAFGRN